jgi:hypothetical protein
VAVPWETVDRVSEIGPLEETFPPKPYAVVAAFACA